MIPEYKLPKGHSLTETSFKQKGTLAQNEYWKYDEFDINGNLVAKLEYWHCTSILPPFDTNEGFKKIDLDGNIIAKS